ncbi:hypothetical protein DM01DRAFT_1297608 [Hesseltinella vesiculosa]|uniref:DNA-directed RNA polymerase III subunit RPC9 n=1 Tax=Hesseltinella vesiculosa TaxID=101127 RepID=A0A1X2GXI2_9FUNG|nr:hypothetical protein DM01DRAFT_1297608 [Hesseltinella vesiculosa]
MIIKNARAALVSNYEVLALLEERQDYQKHMVKANPNLEYPEHLRTIQFELISFLGTTPCHRQNPERIHSLLQKLAPFQLTMGEKLHIVNHRPASDVDIYLLIEECEERFTPDQVQEMIDLILHELPDPESH